jgi:alpha-beta hydrolase superfamily lysophospholipase
VEHVADYLSDVAATINLATLREPGLPVFLLGPSAGGRGSQFFYDPAGSTDKTLELYDGHYHDLLNDIGKEQVMAASARGSMRTCRGRSTAKKVLRYADADIPGPDGHRR